MTKTRFKVKPLVAMLAAASLAAAVPVVMPAPQAQADTYTNLLNAQSRRSASAQREAELRSQLKGVSSELANKIVELDRLTNTRIPAAQQAVNDANEAAATAQDEAEAAADRLEAAQQDKANLEQQIEQTGKDYDDAHAAVASMARESMHGTEASDLMSVVTGATSTEDFVNAMQSRDALSRNEANAAADAATTLNTSKNRSQRLADIEQEIAQLKTKKQQAAATAQRKADAAQDERDALDKLRVQGESKRSELEGLQGELKSKSAKQAAQTVLLQSQVDSYNRQWAQEQADAANQNNNGTQGTTRPNTGGSNTVSPAPSPSPAPNPTPTPSPSPSPAPSTPSGGSSGGQGTSNGDSGNAYAAGQCTYWAYERRHQMGIGTPSYLGNGGQWYYTAPQYGLRVDHNPEVGAALSFLPGQDGADGFYGHVAVVEAVNGNTFTISEMNAAGLWVVSYRTLTNYGQYWFVH